MRLPRFKILRLNPEGARNGHLGLRVVGVVHGLPRAADQRQGQIVIHLVSFRLFLQDLLSRLDAELGRLRRTDLAAPAAPNAEIARESQERESSCWSRQTGVSLPGPIRNRNRPRAVLTLIGTCRPRPGRATGVTGIDMLRLRPLGQ